MTAPSNRMEQPNKSSSAVSNVVSAAETMMRPKTVTMITAVEDDYEGGGGGGGGVPVGPSEHDEDEEDDIIPGPPPSMMNATPGGGRNHRKKDHSSGSAASTSSSRRKILQVMRRSAHTDNGAQPPTLPPPSDPLQISATDHQWAGAGILASRADLELPPEEFAAGCNLLQAAAMGDGKRVEELLKTAAGGIHKMINFRDYDRRTALHVAASEGHLPICKLLIEKYGIRINRSDRWGGSPLDDAHRHRHSAVVQYLREKGALTGNANKSTNLITAAADGDLDEVQMLLHANFKNRAAKQKLDINKGDYDKRTALHLAYVCFCNKQTNKKIVWRMLKMLDMVVVGVDLLNSPK